MALSQCLLAQNIDTLKLFAKQDPGTFWRLVGQYYPFLDEELEKYKYDIRTDENLNINWSLDKLKNNDLSVDLLRNKSIKWNEELINVIKDKRDFDFNELYSDRCLTVSNEFLKNNPHLIVERFEVFAHKTNKDSTTYCEKWNYPDRKLNRLIDYGNTLNSQKPPDQDTTNSFFILKNSQKYEQYLYQDINLIPLEILDSLKEHFFSSWLTNDGKWDLNWDKFLKLNLIYKYNLFYENESIYNCLFKPKMTKEYLSEIYEMLNENESYFEFSGYSSTDEIGYLPSIEYPDTLLKYDFNDYLENPKLQGTDNSFIIKPGTLLQMSEASQGPVRFSDIYPSRLLNVDNKEKLCLVVSNRVHKVFQKFTMTDCVNIPIKLMYNSKWYGSDTMDYWLYMFSNFETTKNILADGTILAKNMDRDSMTITDLISSAEISDPKFVQKYLASSKRVEEFGYFPFKVINLNQKQDLIFDGGNLFASKELVQTIESLKILGFECRKSAQPQYKFKNTPKVNQQKRLELLLKTVGTRNIFSNQKSIRKYHQIKSEISRMAKSKDDVAKILGTQNAETMPDSLSRKLYEFQIKNNVLLPEFYTKAIKNPTFLKVATRGREYNKWDVLPFDRVSLIDKEWAESIPQLYRAVVIAENGLGDYLILLRKQSSPYEISSQLYALWHEMGEIEAVKLAK